MGEATNWAFVACGSHFALALRTDGTLWAWGGNERGQLGLSDWDLSAPNRLRLHEPVSQTLSFPHLVNLIPGDTLELNVTAESGLPVLYTVVGPATLQGSTLSAKAPGTVTVSAYQPGDASWASAEPVVQTIQILPAPEITIEAPLGTDVSSGDTRNMGVVSTEGSASLSFTVVNNGTAELSGFSVTKALTGTPEEFTLDTTGTATSLAPGASTTFTVTFSPTSIGAKSATLDLASNDADENPFLIHLTGIGRLPQKPVMVNADAQQHHVGQVVNLPLAASDNPIRFIVTGLPLGLRYDAITRSIVGQPTTPKLYRTKQPIPYAVKISAANRLGMGPVVTVPWIVLPLPVDLTSRFTGLVARQALVNGNLGSSLSLTITSTGAASGRIWAGPRLLGYRGRLAVAPGGASAVLNTTIPNRNPLEVLTLELALAGGEVSGRVLRGGGEAGVSGWKGQSAPPLEHQGTFHSAMEPQAMGADIPEGWGWAVLKVSRTGTATWSGRLADGSVLTGSYLLGLAGRVPLFTRFPLGRGSVLGWIALNQANGHLDDEVGITWLKNAEPPTSKGRTYKEGIPLHSLTQSGGRYALNQVGLILGFSTAPGNGVVRFDRAGLETPLEQDFELRARNRIVQPLGALAKVTLNASTGRITTSFNIQSGGQRLLVRGSALLVPRLGQGRGYMLFPQGHLKGDAVLSGKVVLEQKATQ
jgi:hypothetical protein